MAKAVKEIEDGIIDANLGGNLYKKRVASKAQGKSKSFRVILAFRAGDKMFFIHGFKKNAKSNISTEELSALKIYGETLLGLDEKIISKMIDSKLLHEVKYDEKEQK